MATSKAYSVTDTKNIASLLTVAYPQVLQSLIFEETKRALYILSKDNAIEYVGGYISLKSNCKKTIPLLYTHEQSILGKYMHKNKNAISTLFFFSVAKLADYKAALLRRDNKSVYELISILYGYKAVECIC